jgi:hypothetical protein
MLINLAFQISTIDDDINMIVKEKSHDRICRFTNCFKKISYFMTDYLMKLKQMKV